MWKNNKLLLLLLRSTKNRVPPLSLSLSWVLLRRVSWGHGGAGVGGGGRESTPSRDLTEHVEGTKHTLLLTDAIAVQRCFMSFRVDDCICHLRTQYWDPQTQFQTF